MAKEKYYGSISEMSGLLKSLFRNQNVFVWRAAKQTDLKASMLVTISFYLWIGIFVVRMQFDTYLHFSPYFLLIPVILILACIIKCIYVLAPNSRFLMRFFKNEMAPAYADSENHIMFNYMSRDLPARERDIDAMVNDHQLQLGNLVRGHYVASKYITFKYINLDKAYNFFLATLVSILVLFLANLILSDGNFHEHNERSSYAKFDFDNPEDVFVLDRELEEISGLTFNMEDRLLYTINDEKGRIYKIHPESGDIVDEYKFGKKGDYEGIEILDGQILVTNSEGDLFISNQDHPQAIIQRTPLGIANDVEGLGYDPELGMVLIACKGEPWLPIEGDRAIYAYNQELHRMDSTVYLDIKISELQNCVDTLYEDNAMKEGLKRRLREFAPSAVAVRPETGDIFVSTAHGSLIAVFDKNKRIRDIVKLNEIICPQPEGLCFDNYGDLYVSTEGHGGTGKIFKFEDID